MSELKADKTFVFGEECEAYKKSEADKVIAELLNESDVYKAKYEQEYDIAVHNEKQLSAMRIEIRHHKYKRCLAMAKRCSIKSTYHFVLFRHGENCKKNYRKSILYSKWYDRWSELAEKFKPNSIAQ